VRESRFRAQKRNFQRPLKRERSGHDFAVNGFKPVRRKRAVFIPAELGINLALAVRRIDLGALLVLQLSDRKGVLRAFVQQVDDFIIKLIYLLAQVLQRRRVLAGRLFRLQFLALFAHLKVFPWE